MPNTPCKSLDVPQVAPTRRPVVHDASTSGNAADASGARTSGKAPSRGITSSVSTAAVKTNTTLRTLLMLDRFRVCRTIDVALSFPERSFKAALTAAQRSVRANVKAGLIKRYKTSRFQTIYGLTESGVQWLDAKGFDASSSVRRVAELTNPEHRLWLQFLVLAAEARGLKALTESELLLQMNAERPSGSAPAQGLLTVQVPMGQSFVPRLLRPDAVIHEDEGSRVVWFEVQLSKMGADKNASFVSLVKAMGAKLKNGTTLSKVVLFAKTPRIEQRALGVLTSLARDSNQHMLVGNRRHFRAVAEGTFEVWGAVELKLPDGRSSLVDRLLGHVIVQALPTWLPKVRLDARNTQPLNGWFSENYLPYKKPPAEGAWTAHFSSLLPQRS